MEHLTYHQFAAGIWTFTLIIAASFTSAAQEQSVIGLAEIEGRTWLITPEGKPFFAHGITHMRNRSLRTDYSAVSRACKNLGFNAYGYGCPNELKSDMPYVEGRNYVPISMYRASGGSFRFIDIFDPGEQQKLVAQVKQTCLQNRDNPNLIGYYWTDLGAWPRESDGRDAVFAELAGRGSNAYLNMVRTQDWKLVHYLDHSDFGELYNLNADPSEIHNLWAQPEYDATKTELLKILREWHLRQSAIDRG